MTFAPDTRRRALSAIAAAAITLAMAGCGNREAETRADRLAETIHRQQVEHFVRTFAIDTPARAVARAERDAQAPTIRALVEQGRLDFEPDPMVRELVTLLFAERDYEHLFVYGTRLTSDGRAVLEAIRQAGDHGFDPEEMHASRAEAIVADLRAAGDLDPLVRPLQLTAEDEGALLAFMLHHAALDGTLPAADAVFEAIAAADPTNPLPHVASAIDELTERLELGAESGPQLELVLAAAFVRYAIALRHDNFGYVPETLAAANDWDLGDADQRPVVLRTLAGASFRQATESGFDVVLDQLVPPFEQYDRLLAGAAEYRRYVEAGGWEPLDVEGALRPGAESDAVAALRRRLAAEEYWDGPMESRYFDEDLAEAVRAYQRSHQLYIDGIVSGGTLRSMNITAERRLAQIMMALEFWRGTRRARHWDREHIWVNVPDFHAELWDGDELVRRWRVIVGRETGQENEDGTMRGRTPLFSDEMRYLVFNPYWNVPDQIRHEEYDPLIEADPFWLKIEGFEIVQDGEREWLRQLPGPNNALGMVKFLFPNEHDVYMHDTPNRSLFSRVTRAFSHGCIRVHDPMDLAHLLLARDRDWSDWRTERFIEDKLEMGDEQWVNLIHPLPIHIEYVSVRGGDDGRVEFLADPYLLDRPLVDEWQDRLFGAVDEP